MAKELCKWKKKEIEKNLRDITRIVETSRFVCKDCARSACEKNYLCKPIKLASAKE